jgi:hypothetical protein
MPFERLTVAAALGIAVLCGGCTRQQIELNPRLAREGGDRSYDRALGAGLDATFSAAVQSCNFFDCGAGEALTGLRVDPHHAILEVFDSADSPPCGAAESCPAHFSLHAAEAGLTLLDVDSDAASDTFMVEVLPIAHTAVGIAAMTDDLVSRANLNTDPRRPRFGVLEGSELTLTQAHFAGPGDFDEPLMGRASLSWSGAPSSWLDGRHITIGEGPQTVTATTSVGGELTLEVVDDAAIAGWRLERYGDVEMSPLTLTTANLAFDMVPLAEAPVLGGGSSAPMLTIEDPSVVAVTTTTEVKLFRSIEIQALAVGETSVHIEWFGVARSFDVVVSAEALEPS